MSDSSKSTVLDQVIAAIREAQNRPRNDFECDCLSIMERAEKASHEARLAYYMPADRPELRQHHYQRAIEQLQELVRLLHLAAEAPEQVRVSVMGRRP